MPLAGGTARGRQRQRIDPLAERQTACLALSVAFAALQRKPLPGRVRGPQIQKSAQYASLIKGNVCSLREGYRFFYP